MARWSEFESAAPELAGRVRERFDAGRHKVLATLRQDGSPRVSGIESAFAGADLWFGGMADSRKILDLLRDPRFALHSASVDPPVWTGDAKVAGRAVAVTDPAELAAVIAAASSAGSGPVFPGRCHGSGADPHRRSGRSSRDRVLARRGRTAPSRAPLTGAVDAAFFDACFEAFAGSDWLVVAATGRTDPSTLRPLPPNVIARPHLPQLAVLQHAGVFVTHGGMNSTMEGLWYGVPLVVVPQGADQPLVAERVAALRLGRTLEPDVLTGAAVREAVIAVTADNETAANVAKIQAEMRAGGGAQRAAADVEHFAAQAR